MANRDGAGWGMRRQRRAIEWRIPGAYGQELARSGTRLRGELSLRVHEGGRVRARIPTLSRYNSPPTLIGRIVAEPAGAVLTGEIRESRLEVLTPRLFSMMALSMAAVMAGLLAAGEFTSPGVYVGGGSAIVFGFLGYWLGRLRRESFRLGADHLERLTRIAVHAGSVS